VRKNNNNRNHFPVDGDGCRPRLSVHLDESDKAWWIDELARVAQVDGLGGRPSMGVLLHRIARADIKLDERSIQRIVDLLAEPAELSHKPVKKARAAR
jgi:hypothetical protein